jgi:hypothetical protein
LVHEFSRKQPEIIKELLEIPTRHALGEEAIGAAFDLVEAVVTAGGGQTAAPNITTIGTKKGAKGRKKGQKRCSHHPAAVTNNGSVGEKIERSDEEFVASTKRNFKRRTRPPKDHFEKVLEAAYPHYPYPVKHKLRDHIMMKRFMPSGTPATANELARNLGGRGTVLITIGTGAVSFQAKWA